MKPFSRQAEEEMRALSGSLVLRQEMEVLAASRSNPFVRAGQVDADAFITFVQEFNEFINHQPKRFRPMTGSDMRL